MRGEFEARAAHICRRLNSISGVVCPEPGGAFYVFPDVRSFGLSSGEFAMGLLEAENVAAVPGDAFGASGEGFLRCCYATAFDQLKEALERIERYVGTLESP